MKKRSANRTGKGRRHRTKNQPATPARHRRLLAVAILVGVVAVVASIVWKTWDTGRRVVDKELAGSTVSRSATPSERRLRPEYVVFRAPDYARDHSFNSEAVLVWGGDHQFTEGLRQNEVVSNIRRTDYAGAESCRECHRENHQSWSDHAHRWMNATANEESVKGDFSGGDASRIEYWGGTATFYRQDGYYMMKLARDGVTREFKIQRTLGSRVHQYYMGVLVDGPEGNDHAYRTTDHVLPFGYELTLKEWVPIVHATGQQGPDAARDDPFETPSRLPYDTSCSMCHTTQPMGNLMLAMFKRFAAYSPRKIHFEGSNYIDEVHPGAVRLGLAESERLSTQNLKYVVNDLADQSQKLIHEDNAVDLGIACEACHHGAKAHAENERIRPLFFPAGPHVFASGSDEHEIWGRNSANKNFICARCHSGDRPRYAAGISTWNSTEYTDAARGHCYNPDRAAVRGMDSLTCVACHNPHEAIGRRWTNSPADDNKSCIACHTQYRDESVAQAHTHHPIGSTGGECMNCHMPKINEGLGDMVRTHTIFSPTNVPMLEANHPNACNMCHVEESIDWTLQYLAEWYGLFSRDAGGPATGTYSDKAIDENYPDRTRSAAQGWLASPHSATRLVGADVLLKARADWALMDLLDTLDDPYMENRQFSVQRLRDYMDIDTRLYGYRHYMTADERKEPLRNMIRALVAVSGELPMESSDSVPDD